MSVSATGPILDCPSLLRPRHRLNLGDHDGGDSQLGISGVFERRCPFERGTQLRYWRVDLVRDGLVYQRQQRHCQSFGRRPSALRWPVRAAVDNSILDAML